MKSILGSMLLGLFLALAYGAQSLYQASRDKAIAPNEAMVTANVHQQSNTRTTALSYARCAYTFEAGGNLYFGRDLCPSDGTTSAAKGLAGVRPDSNATVYYDPNNPNINSLVEFSARVPKDYLKARLGFALAAACVLFLGIGLVIAVRMSQPGGGMMVDAQGTTIYPDQIKSDPDDERFSAHPTHISSEETD